ncbi:hypothetical protein Tcan_00108 [Toxocara canis]|uniref:Uncharacterized protein n=1 Tax=Toxocara canis TaxID=6265 RepID=A0A0B2V1C9_TOXCA|nr:hypothetical protein Tcan_00108 [Toxocara canis]
MKKKVTSAPLFQGVLRGTPERAQGAHTMVYLLSVRVTRNTMRLSASHVTTAKQHQKARLRREQLSESRLSRNLTTEGSVRGCQCHCRLACCGGHQRCRRVTPPFSPTVWTTITCHSTLKEQIISALPAQ